MAEAALSKFKGEVQSSQVSFFSLVDSSSEGCVSTMRLHCTDWRCVVVILYLGIDRYLHTLCCL